MENRIVIVETNQLIELIKSAINEVLHEKNETLDEKQIMNLIYIKQ